MNRKKNILVAPLNWGLGHATRCIPIIRQLLHHEFNPIIASDGSALDFLKNEFPYLDYISLPSYNIEYTKKGSDLKYKLLRDTPAILTSILKEKRMVGNLVNQGRIDGIISDNRFGVRNNQVPSVFITHQLNVLSGNTTWLSSKVQQYLIKRFDETWVPDVQEALNLSGDLGHLEATTLNIKYIGPLSRFDKKNTTPQFDIGIILSGPEPQRTLLEKKLYKQFLNTDQKVLFVRGIVEQEHKVFTFKNITVHNFMNSNQLEPAINSCNVIISRSGYSTIMDLARLEKQAYLIPTPGQYEQEYLAQRSESMGVAPYCPQDEFNVGKLEQVPRYSGFKNICMPVDFKKLFGTFNQLERPENFSKVKENSEPTPNSLST